MSLLRIATAELRSAGGRRMQNIPGRAAAQALSFRLGPLPKKDTILGLLMKRDAQFLRIGAQGEGVGGGATASAGDLD
jgi:hypothetical protein